MAYYALKVHDYLFSVARSGAPLETSEQSPRDSIPDPTQPWLRADALAASYYLSATQDEEIQANETFNTLKRSLEDEDNEEETPPSICADVQSPRLDRNRQTSSQTYQRETASRTRIRKELIEQLAQQSNRPRKRYRSHHDNIGSNVSGVPGQGYRQPAEDESADNEHPILMLKAESLSLHRELKQHCINTQFDAYFALGCQDKVEWQEGKIFIGGRTRRAGRIAGETDPMADNCTAPLSHKDICLSIKTCHTDSTSLHILLEDDSLRELRMGSKMHIDAPAAISLKSIFDFQQEIGEYSVFSRRGRLTLSLLLAAMIQPLLETPWLLSDFSYHDVYFLKELGALPDLTNPFIFTRLDTLAKQTNSHNSHQNILHPHPTVLALGILLLEIYRCRPLTREDHGPNQERSLNREQCMALEILQKEISNEEGDDYCEALSACLNARYFPPGQHFAFDSAIIQTKFCENVISRLLKCSNKWIKDMGHLQILNQDHAEKKNLWSIYAQDRHTQLGKNTFQASVVETKRAVSTHPPIANSLAENSTGLTAAQIGNTYQRQIEETATAYCTRTSCVVQAPVPQGSLFDVQDNILQYSKTSAGSSMWLKKLDTLIHSYVNASLPPCSRAPIRIAILDTGYTPNLVTDEIGRPDPRIRATRNFVLGTDGPSLMQDKIGHGTHTLGLLLRTAICADIFVGKIADDDNSTINREGYKPITEAIRYAAAEWKVDIITMSFGIRENDADMENAISEAAKKDILLFAAASNDGLFHKRTFPAANYKEVFGIHSMDSNGVSSKFNPKPYRTAFNLTSLGEDVVSDWPSGVARARSGSSIATPIIAGFVASVLAFVQQQETSLLGKPSILSWLKRPHGMEELLKELVVRKDNYDMLSPWKFFCHPVNKESVYEKIRQLKENIYNIR
ncbi:intracellular serine protease [Arthroderma uncinatum]|uniref:intracellular serine protease n=1 Tax=Arthroderma uncinatum TaxID=74035 RepID=UPI00144A9AFC|nr:intracellular serine protease [Arthroderma uncinatum]KAF3480194.1 intracellular serine protease [Arthroderma uncinatum]